MTRQPARTDGDIGQIVRSMALAFLLTAAPIGLHVISQPVAIIFCVVSAILAARAFEQDVPAIVLVANVFQNTFIALVSVNYRDFSDIELLKSYNFITTIVCYATIAYAFLSETGTFSPFIRRMIFASIGVLIVVGVYFVLGLAVNPRAAIIYLRNIVLPIFFFQTFLIAGVRHHIPAPHLALTLLVLVMICCYIELFASSVWLQLTNGQHYFELFSSRRLLNVDEIRIAKEAGIVVVSPMDYGRASLFNTTLTSDLGLQVQRLSGPNFNTISLAYLLAILMAFLALHGFVIVTALALPLLLATSAKGPLALFLGSVAFYWLARRSNAKAPIAALGCGLLAYALFVFQSGYQSGDYHVLGLLGGLNGFLKLPIGHTLGEGGNLSIEDFSRLDWGAFQRSGAADVAVESAFGVMLYQLGLSAIFVFAFYFWIARIAWRLYGGTRAPGMAFATVAIAICMVNGLFQEDAYFVPLSLPIVTGLSALVLGAADRALAPGFVRLQAKRG